MIRLRPDLLPQTTVYVGPTTAPPPPNLAALLPPAPALRLSVAEVRGLLRALLPLPRLDLRAAVALLRYQRRHKLAAYWSHRKRRLQRLADLHPPSLLVVILVGTGTSRGPLTIGFFVGAAIMIAGGVIAWFFGVNAERKSLEDISTPLSAVSRPVGGTSAAPAR